MRDQLAAFSRSLVAYHKGNGDQCIEPALLEKGTWFEGRRHSDEYPTAKEWKSKAEPQHCYANSQHYCVQDKQAHYFEGYSCLSGLHPFEHAWIVMPDGGVVDFTLELMEVEAAKRHLTCDTSGALYLGLEIPRKYIRQRMAEEGETQPLLELFYAADVML